MIKLEKKNFNGIDFVCKALSTDKTKIILNYIHVTEQYIYGSDGCRMHWINNSHNLKPGLYDIIKKTKTEIILSKSDTTAKYPNVEYLINQTNHFTETKYNNNNSLISLFTYYIFNKLGICADISFLTDIYNHTNNNDITINYDPDKINNPLNTYDGAIKFNWSNNYNALIMSIKIKKN
jgi:hypothetical protein